MASETNKIYCSLDIETSGFDPLKNEILEVGLAFFTIEANGTAKGGNANGTRNLKIVEEWTQVFRPSQPVSPQIFGLTGISQKELDQAPKFSEYQKFLQDKLGEAVIVGHNIVFDLKFLEAFGLKFSGKTIDTLDLVQWLLPTHHSYNLENLMHTFGISHKEAHRALADSKACIYLMEKLFGVYAALPKKTKQEIEQLLKSRDVAWKEFLDNNFAKVAIPDPGDTKPLETTRTTPKSFKLQPQVIYNYPLGEDVAASLSRAALSLKDKALLVLPFPQQVLALQKQGIADTAIFLPENLFSAKKFTALQKKQNLTPEELRFVLKILVWQSTNWQQRTILDLNLSFFGGQFRSFITGGEIPEKILGNLAVCDQATFLYLSQHGLGKDREVLIYGLSEFENSVTADIGSKASWGYVNYLLKAFYNPELETGAAKFKETVNQGLLAGDLFFGLVNALLQTNPPGFVNVKISPEFEYDEKYGRIKHAVENYLSKLKEVNIVLASRELERFMTDLGNFFAPQDNRVKWIEFSENRCVFLSMPVDISGLVAESLKPYTEISFADSLAPLSLYDFFQTRLGLRQFTVQSAAQPSSSVKQSPVKQGDLFGGFKTLLAGRPKAVNFKYLPQLASDEELLEIIAKDQNLPAAILFPSSMQVREFYDRHYQELKSRMSVLSQNASGGSNKIFRNFSINPKSLLLCSDKFILKFLTAQNAVEPVRGLLVRTLVICRLPFEQFTHPYQEAVSKSFPNAFMDYAMPKALLNLHCLIKFFYSPALRDVIVIDPKLSKDYAQVFKGYYKFVPEGQLKN